MTALSGCCSVSPLLGPEQDTAWAFPPLKAVVETSPYVKHHDIAVAFFLLLLKTT